MRFLNVSIVMAACIVAVPAAGQGMKVTTTPLFGVGMQVTDASGAPVGTVIAMTPDGLRVKTDKHEVTLPKASFQPTNGTLVIGMTQAQLDAQAEQTVAAAAPAPGISAGEVVKSVDGKQVGKVDSIADGNVIVALDSGSRLAVPEAGARANPDGTVLIGYTSAQIAGLGNKPAQ